MFPHPFEYHAPTKVAEAVALLERHGDQARLLAGGHSLLPAMKLRLSQPRVVIDIGRIADLSGIAVEQGELVIGANTTHSAIEAAEQVRRDLPGLADCAGVIGDPQVRGRGTIGGSLAHADPAADYPAVMLALAAVIEIAGPGGRRQVPASEFFVTFFTTALQTGEVITGVRIPLPGAGVGSAYLKHSRRASDFAVVGVAAQIALAADGSCSQARVGITGVAPTAFRATAVEDALRGSRLDADTLTAAAAQAATGVADVQDDFHASAEFRTHLATVYTRRAVALALERAQG